MNSNSKMLQRRRDLRKQATPAERRLWSLLRNKQLGGFKFRRQHQILNYIVDFFCFSERLIVELDGPIHNSKTAREYDQRRDALLRANKYRILRFRNSEVFRDEKEVLNKILEELQGTDAKAPE